MTNNTLNPVTVIGAGADSQNQVIGQRMKIVEITRRDGRQGEDPRKTRVSYQKVEDVTSPHPWKVTLLSNTMPFSKRFRERNHHAYWANWCLKDDVSLYNLNEGGCRISIRKLLRKNSRVKALMSGAVVVYVCSSGYREFRNNMWCPYRCFSDYVEYRVVDGVEFQGKIFPL